METVTIKLTTPKTMRLLEQLEELNLLKVLRRSDAIKESIADKYAGKLPADIADDIQIHIEESRRAWDISL
jgi:hypothetical protein